MVEEVNRKFGTNITVELSGAWRAEVTRYEDISGEDEIDETETQTEEEEVKDDAENETGEDPKEPDDNNTV